MLMLRSVVRWPPPAASGRVTLRSLVTVALALCCGAAIGQGKTVRSYQRKNVEPPTRPNANTYSGEAQVQPTFDNTTSRNVSTQLGKTAYLHCRVKNLGDRSVSWIRHRDLHILTVGRYTYTSDQRFQAIHLERSDDWTLQIKYPQKRDNGTYECQVSTEPKISMFFNLSVVEEDPNDTSKPPVRRHGTSVARATIDGNQDIFMKTGSTINLTCTITQSPHPPTYVFWYHNEKVVTIDSPRGGISVETIKGDITTSKLIITKAQPSDSGNYTCNPSNANAASINVHVLNGEKPAAMQHGGQGRFSINSTPSALAGLVLLFFTVVPVIL